jgi:phosphoserine phosphatase
MKVVVTDVDGVVFDVGSSWREFHRHFGTYDESKVENLRKLYLSGRISYQEWGDEEVKVWKGLPYSKFEEICMNFPLVEGAGEAVKEIKGRGYYLAAVSSGGLKRPVEKRLKALGYDEVHSNDLEEVDGILTGKFILSVEYKNKHSVVEKILEEMGASWDDCIVVGDDMNDRSMIRKAGLSIAFCPKDERLVKSAKVVVTEKNLRRVLDYL